jgi:hypothetical protein
MWNAVSTGYSRKVATWLVLNLMHTIFAYLSKPRKCEGKNIALLADKIGRSSGLDLAVSFHLEQRIVFIALMMAIINQWFDMVKGTIIKTKLF